MILAERWADCARRVETELAAVLPPAEAPPSLLHEAMRYSTLGGGKRLRGYLVVAAAEAVGAPAEPVLPAACAVELVHAYSLIHDDLPCMDDDDWRRGRPSAHRVYGEAIALLAGDALLTLAFEVMANGARAAGASAEQALAATVELAVASGSRGMAGGQADDLLGEGRQLAVPELESIHRRKTGALIRASVRIGALLGGATPRELAALTRYGEAVGLAFQITDDLLDVEGEAEKTGKTVRKDAARAKATYPGLLGIEEARRRAREAAEEAKQAVAGFGERGEVLAALADFILQRDR
ncbi:MAG: polyprenyl synthetase family protein [Bacillota bacterium]|nr:polyprenyl synthetase family protein [Bacillota bacterium]